jgi:hypothetical protein
MVSVRYLSLVFLVVIAPVCAEETLNYEDYQRAIGAGQERLDYSKRLIGHDQLHTLVPGVKESKSQHSRVPSPVEPEGAEESDTEFPNKPSGSAGANRKQADVSKRSDPPPVASPDSQSVSPKPKPSEQGRADAKTKPRREIAVQTHSASTRYISPSLRGGNGRGQRNEARVTRSNSHHVKFGISLGTEIKVSLDDSASNVQPGFIKLKVEETVRGRKSDLPYGSTLFARSSAVIGSERLFLSVSRGVTPDGDEFNAQGVVFDDKRKPGLAARVVSDGKTLARAGSEGLNTLGKELLNAAPTSGATGAATEATLGQLLKEKAQGDQAAQGRPAYVVVASPQAATVQIESTF